MTDLVTLDREMLIAHRLRQHGINVFDGTTTPEIRRERARKAIVDAGLSAVIMGRKGGKPVTYGEYFQMTFGEAL